MRKTILSLTFLIIVAMCLYPPWLRTFNLGTRWPALSTHKWSLPSEYSFLWSAPEYSSTETEPSKDGFEAWQTENAKMAERSPDGWGKGDVLVKEPPDWLVPRNKNLIITITATPDIRRLAVQCFIVLLVGGGLAYLWPEKKKPTEG